MGQDEPRLSRQALQIISVLMEAPSADWYGLEIAQRANLKSGTVYPTMARFERYGWLTSAWEEVDPSEAKRPRRRLYHLTGEGQRAAAAALEEALRALSPPRPPRRPEGRVRPA